MTITKKIAKFLIKNVRYHRSIFLWYPYCLESVMTKYCDFCEKHGHYAECDCKTPYCECSVKGRSKIEELSERIRELERERSEIICRVGGLQEDGVWNWMNDESDDFDSMSNQMVVKIMAGDIRTLIRQHLIGEEK